jgi:hypothetical protein
MSAQARAAFARLAARGQCGWHAKLNSGPLYSECELGAMPPFGPLYKQPVVVDKSLTLDPEILFNAGSHREAIRMRYRDFEELVKPTVADFGIPIRVS